MSLWQQRPHLGHDLTFLTGGGMDGKLKAPMPWFGGKARVAHLIWERLGDPDNAIEPFCGSCAFLLARPHPPRIETVNDPALMVSNVNRAIHPEHGDPPAVADAFSECVNDLDPYVANVWRSLQSAPEETAEWADYPVDECQLHSVHRWLVLGEEAETFRERMRADPDFFDPVRAGRWLWGICAWIGSGWCDLGQLERHQNATPVLIEGQGVHRTSGDGDPASKVRIAGHNKASCGKGVHAQGELPEQRPQLDGNANGKVSNGGVPCTPVLWQQRPFITGYPSQQGRGVHAGNPSDLSQKRPAISGGSKDNEGPYEGQGVHAKGTTELHAEQGTCEQRREWLLAWFCRLRDRLRNVRVCCGDWRRVCSSDSVLTRLGSTGVYLDPPYGKGAKRKKGLYSQDSETVAADVRRWCLEHGDNRDLRIVLSGYAEEGHEELERHGWTVIHWTSSGGYGNSTEQGRKNRKKERLWCSPHCVVQRTLFDNLEVTE